MNLLTETPANWREGQTLFNFLEFLADQGFVTGEALRMADPFHIPDATLRRMYKLFLENYEPSHDHRTD